MTESHPRDYWDIPAVSHALASVPLPRLHETHGNGFSLPLGNPDEPVAEIDVYPETGMLRYRGEGITLAVSRAVPLVIEQNAVVFNASTPTEIRTIRVGFLGEMDLYVAPRDMTPPPPPEAHKPPKETRERESRQALRFVGFIENEPQFGTTPRGKPIARIAVRQMTEDGEIFHNLIAVNSLAETLRGSLKPGDEVRVVGYPQESGDMMAAVIRKRDRPSS